MFNRREMMQASAFGLTGLFLPKSVEKTNVENEYNSDFVLCNTGTNLLIINNYDENVRLKVIFESKSFNCLEYHDFCISSLGEAFDFLVKEFPDACRFEISSFYEPELFGWKKVNGQWEEINE